MTQALTTLFIYLLIIVVFIFRMAVLPKWEYAAGLVLMLALIPLVYLFVKGLSGPVDPLYLVQLGLMIGFLVVELFLDYLTPVDFRNIRWLTIAYVTLFYAATGGMMGVAAQSGKTWLWPAAVLFFIMVGISLYQHFTIESQPH